MDDDGERRVREAVAKRREAAGALSDALAAYPETGHNEFASSRRIAALLAEAGFAVTYPYLGLETAFRATFENGAGPEVALLVEYDALPDIGHGCGHNLHGALSVLSALSLRDLSDLYHGTIHVIGTPAEETDGAKIAMAARGAFDGLALAMMMHSIGGGVCEPNMVSLGLRNVTCCFRGKSAHAVAKPWAGRSALAAARKFLDLIDANRECFAADLRVNAVFKDGGRVPNIIPDYAELVVEFRASTPASLENLAAIVERCAKGAALALGCEVSIRQSGEDFLGMLRIPALEAEAARLLGALGLSVRPVSAPIGSTDMGNVSYRCPAIQPLIAITDADYALHTVEFARATLESRAKDAMALGAQALTLLALRVLREAAFRQEVYESFCREREINGGPRPQQG